MDGDILLHPNADNAATYVASAVILARRYVAVNNQDAFVRALQAMLPLAPQWVQTAARVYQLQDGPRCQILPLIMDRLRYRIRPPCAVWSVQYIGEDKDDAEAFGRLLIDQYLTEIDK